MHAEELEAVAQQWNRIVEDTADALLRAQQAWQQALANAQREAASRAATLGFLYPLSCFKASSRMERVLTVTDPEALLTVWDVLVCQRQGLSLGEFGCPNHQSSWTLHTAEVVTLNQADYIKPSLLSLAREHARENARRRRAEP